jgi:predicted AlkP superfamily phosphohydrolase/phosphomutase
MTHSQETHQPQVPILGLDGATCDLIKPWVATGQLPTFKHLMDTGTQASLESIIPPITPPAWTSFMSGMNPGKHGVFNFTEYHLRGRFRGAPERSVDGGSACQSAYL